MKAPWAILTIVGALVLGAVGGAYALRSTQPVLRIAVGCLIVNEAMKAGYLNAEKRSALIARLAESPSLTASDRSFVPALADCH
jgi:hypothetical protein